MDSPEKGKAALSIPSILSVVAAILSFRAGAILGLFLAGVAIVFGILGLLLALSPKTKGGIFSLLGMLGGAAGIVAAIIKAIMWIASA